MCPLPPKKNNKGINSCASSYKIYWYAVLYQWKSITIGLPLWDSVIHTCVCVYNIWIPFLNKARKMLLNWCPLWQAISSTLLTWYLDSGYESAVNRGIMIVTNMKYLLVCKFDKYSLRLHISILEKVVDKLKHAYSTWNFKATFWKTCNMNCQVCLKICKVLFEPKVFSSNEYFS